MSRRKRILTVFGTRPEAIKLFPVIHRIQQDSRLESRVCVSGQHREMLDQVLDISGIRPNYDLAVMRPSQTLHELTASLMTGMGRIFEAEQPDWVVVQGDTATALCGALAAFYLRIPVAHVEAGLRSGNSDHPWPEEGNRKIISTLAALHFAPTAGAAESLRRENVDSATIHVTGNTVIDALHWIEARLAQESDLAADVALLERRFPGKRIVLVTTHRRENFGQRMKEIAGAIRRIASRPDVAVVFPVHLNPEVRKVMETELAGLSNVALLQPLDYPNFIRLLQVSALVLSDSGGVQEEAPALGKPVLVMRETTERPEGLAAGTARLVGTDADQIFRETCLLLDDANAYAAMARARNPFGDGKSSARIANILAQA